MSIQSSINQMLSSIANQQLYKGLTKGIENIKTEVGNVGTEVSKTKKAIQKQTKSQAAGAYKQNQALAALMTQNQGTPQLTPDNAPEAPKSEDIPWTVGEIPTYYAVEASPERQAQIDRLEKQYGSLDEAFKMADIGQTSVEDQQRLSEFFANPDEDQIYEDYIRSAEATAEYESSIANTRVKMQQVSAQRTQENIAQRLQKAKAERSQAKQEFLKNKGGKHR